MSDPALSPVQLDRLEDALEDLELAGIPAGLLDPDDDDARGVADTLEVYRSILVLSRKALPTEEVPAGLLDDVLAEARRAAATPAKVERAVPWWRRLGGWGPALAFAGTAALLVVLVRPTGESEDRAAVARNEAPGVANGAQAPEADEANAQAAPAELAAAQEEMNAEDEDARDLDGSRLAEAQGLAEAKDEWDELGGEGAEGRGAGADATRRERKVATKLPATDPVAEVPAGGAVGGASKSSSSTATDKKAKGGGGYDPPPASSKPTATPKPAPQKSGPTPGSSGAPAEPKSPAPVSKADDAEETKAKKEVPDGWADISSGDAKRRAGACSSAKTAYQRASEDDSAEVRARAFAGLGLCELQAGNASAAEALFSKARAADPKVGKLIESERVRHEPQDQAQADEAPAP